MFAEDVIGGSFVRLAATSEYQLSLCRSTSPIVEGSKKDQPTRRGVEIEIRFRGQTMDSFEQVVATILDRAGYWVRTSVKVHLTREEKQAIGRPSAPRWELDIVAYGGTARQLLVVECKTYLDSGGVRAGSFEGPKASEETRYKLFSDETLRRVVLSRLDAQLVEQGFCPPGTKAQLCLAAGNIYGDPAALHAIFAAKGWQLFDRNWLRAGLEALATESYENSVASIVAKLLLRDRESGTAPDDDDGEPVTRTSGYSTQPGFTNSNGQTVLRATGLPGTDYGQSIYALKCGRCAAEYGANGSDIWLRKCPQCQGGRPGLSLTPVE
jgi:hypothetical protein